MPMVLNSNVASLKSQRNLSTSQASLAQAMERLSSGKRINSAKDDAAGSAISTILTAQVRGLNQATRNSSDGISLLQTAEGALSEIGSALQRMRELSVQSANGTYTEGNRETLNAELHQLVSEIDRVSKTTDYNGLKLLDGSALDLDIQVGADFDQKMKVAVRKIDADSLGISDSAGLGSFQRCAYGGETDTTGILATQKLPAFREGDLVINGVTIGGAIASADTASFMGKDKSTIAIAAAINAKAKESGVKAVVGETIVSGYPMSPAWTDVAGAIQVNGIDINVHVMAGNPTATRAGIVAAINQVSEQTGVVAIDTEKDESGIVLKAADGRNIVLANKSGNPFGPPSSVLLTGMTGLHFTDGFDSAVSGIFTATMTLVATEGQDIHIDNNVFGRAENAGFRVGAYNGTKTGLVSTPVNMIDTGNRVYWNTQTGATLINGVPVPKSDSGINNVVSAINSISDKTGVVAVMQENRAVNHGTQRTVAGMVTGSINGVEIAGFAAQAGADKSGYNRAMLVRQVNAISGQTGVIAVDTGVDGTAEGGGVMLIDKIGKPIFPQLFNGDLAGCVVDGTINGSYTLQSDREIEITSGLSNNLITTGLLTGNYGGGQGGQSLSKIDIATVEGANKAIQAIDNALNRVNNVRAKIGAYQNRLEFTVNNLTNFSQNSEAARSRIEDADFAAETAALSRSQILQQSSSAMLAQANSSALQVLQLLRTGE
ncbi:flagellin [Allochromatium humboldtianum]|uniref:Flagellin n=1 Tax=Allochromatium humboldtianum TaxID=504901 RepID=A0A850REK6_9GAMM|nr:flagellin [Allochromatium humboldtianum]NVZ09767.1 flagellin [Allochromatium humboldtianum]